MFFAHTAGSCSSCGVSWGAGGSVCPARCGLSGLTTTRLSPVPAVLTFPVKVGPVKVDSRAPLISRTNQGVCSAQVSEAEESNLRSPGIAGRHTEEEPPAARDDHAGSHGCRCGAGCYDLHHRNTLAHWRSRAVEPRCWFRVAHRRIRYDHSLEVAAAKSYPQVFHR